MHLWRGLYNVPKQFTGCVATIGNFDGMHLGHQALLRALSVQAQALKLPSLVIIFEPQPKEFFAPEKAPARIANFREKVQAFARCGVDYVLCLPFNQNFRSLCANDFIEKVLVDAIKVKHLIVGDDFRFGHDRSGDFSLLQQAGAKHSFKVQDTNTVADDGERISSTRVREALASGDLTEVARLLGRPYCMSGRVAYGRQLGRTINTPTANIMVKRLRLPFTGVFAVTVKDEDNGQQYTGVASVGIKPTVADTPEPSLEVHLFDVNKNLYHRHLTVEFLQKIREEQKFNGLDELKTAINADKQTARQILSQL